MNTKLKLSTAFLLIAVSTWFYFTPHLAAKEMKSAAEAKDVAKLASYVDFPALKENLKSSFNAKIASGITKDKSANPVGALGSAMAGAFVNPMVDALVTPENLAKLMSASKPQTTKTDEQTKSSDSDTDVSTSYESFNRFVVKVKKKGSKEEPVGLVFNLDGLFSWKLSDLQMSL
jgi:Protein of unknown function (DUF2939)